MTRRQWVFYLESVPFTRAIITGQASLGGSESAALGMMRALVRRGHEVQAFARRLEEPGEIDGVLWHRAESDLGPALSFLTPDVFVSLRLPTPFVSFTVPASLNVLWNEDLLIDPQIVSTLSQVDELWYVSEYHKQQWGDRDAIAKMMPSYVTKNGIDPDLYPVQVWPGGASWRDGVTVVRDPHRYIYVSRPERALRPLLELWPEIRKADPEARLGLCRYESMYDGEGTAVQQMVDSYDALTRQVAERVGGIDWLGKLAKRPLAEAIAGSRAMLYPGVADFAETSCLAAVEAQASGTPLIASWRGALPETLHPEAGILIDGSPDEDAYRADFCAAVAHLRGLSDPAFQRLQDAGRRHVKGYSFDVIAAELEAHVEAAFAARYAAQKRGVLKQLLHWDRHVMALQVANDIESMIEEEPNNANGSEWRKDALEAAALCEAVIAGKHQQAQDYAAHALPDPILERDHNQRFQAIVAGVRAQGLTPRRCLDLACGNGSLALTLAQAFPDAHVRGVDYSSGVLEMARRGAETAGVTDRVTFAEGGFPFDDVAVDAAGGPYDLVTAGEFIEHVEEPHALIAAMEARCAPDGLCVFTTPCGPFAELLPTLDIETRKRGHLHAFSHQQLTRLMQGRPWHLDHLAIGMSRYGVQMGYWIVTWRPNREQPPAALDFAADVVAIRPRQTVTGIMIVKDGEEWLRKCLGSLGSLDAILVHDTGSQDESRELCRKVGATVVETDWPDSFAVARNRVLADAEARGADWVLWIDADEHLEHAERLRRYTTGAGPYLGYVIRQQHLMLDAPSFHDKPARLFRTQRGVRFYGAIHEQPETAPDAGVWPSLELPDVDIIHLGYHRDEGRRAKLLARNLPLLKKQLEAPAGERRRLDIVLFIRDCANIAQFEREAFGQVTPKARTHAEAGIAAYLKHLADPVDKYHSLARPFYETCLQLTGRGFEVGWALAAGSPSLQGKLAPERFRVANLEEAERELQARMAAILMPFRPVAVPTLPCVRRTGHGLAG